MNVISWSQANASGMKRYFTGKPCAKGHIAERYTGKSACVVCQSERLTAYQRKQRESRGAVRWPTDESERRARRAAALRRYAETHSDQLTKSQQKYRALHPERSRQIKQKWAEANREYLRLKSAKRAKENPELYRLYAHQRRARQVGMVSTGIIKFLLREQRGRCANCRHDIRLTFEIDHIEPLARGGAHEDGNLQLLCGDCNRRKSAKDPIVWAQEQGRLI